MYPRVVSTTPAQPSLRIVSNRTVYHHSIRVDLTSVRAVHALEHCPCITDPSLGLKGADCGSVHYGLCSPLILRPAVDIQTLQTLTPIVAKAESIRDKIQAAIELLAVEEEPADLETLLRNFVIEDRRRQESKQLSAPELDSKSGKKIIIRSQPLLDVINNQRNDGRDVSPNRQLLGALKGADNNTTQSLVRSRLSKFDQHRSRSLSPSPSASVSEPSSPSVDSYQSSLSTSSSKPSEKLIFGISPKSNSLSRYKSIIESRNNGPTSQSSSSQSYACLQSGGTNGNRNHVLGHNMSEEPPNVRNIYRNNTPVSGCAPKIDALPSAQSPPHVSVPVPNSTGSSSCAPTLSVIDSECTSTPEHTHRPFPTVSADDQQSTVGPMSPSPVKTVTSNGVTPSATPPKGQQHSSPVITRSTNGSAKSRPLSAPDGSIGQFIVDQLTDDEKAILQRNSQKSTNDVTVKQNVMNNTGKCAPNGTGITNGIGMASKPKPANDRPKPRIITLSKPLPKPEPKTAEPKYVNGKLVFGQIPVKPFLAKGSVAERVLLFEKCPEKTSVTKVKMNDKNRDKMIYNKVGQWMKLNDSNNNNNKKNEIFSRRFSRSNSLTGVCPPGQLPKFYYPLGRPYSSHEVESQIRRITGVFDRFPARIAGRKEFATILKTVGLPLYWKEPLFTAVVNNAIINNNNNNNHNNVSNGNGKKEVISCEAFVDYWKKVISSCYDNTSRFVKILTEGQRNYLLPQDFEPMIQDVIDSHPGLAFLKDAEEFHSRYVHTVIARIFYCVNKSWTGRITLPELKKSNFLQVVSLLEEEDDINQITDYFSYEHFYVIYCKFWELDKDHDLYISKVDLSRHNDSAISSRMIDRIFSGAVTRGQTRKDGFMSYSEFVWFLLSEEDKRHPRSIEYWFRCMDLDGDGLLSMYELEYFYSEQIKRMEAICIEALPFSDCLCQMLDLVRPQQTGRISLSDLKRCRLTPIFFDTFFNLEKYLDHEQRDPFASSRDEDGLTMSDWDRFAAEEYELLVAEESSQQNNSNLLDFTGECGLNEYLIANSKYHIRARTARVDDDDYDYCDTDDSDYS